jgi:hypothetical protein
MLTLLASHPHITAYLLQAARTCVWLALLVALFAPLEHFFAVRPRQAVPQRLGHEPRMVFRQ